MAEQYKRKTHKQQHPSGDRYAKSLSSKERLQVKKQNHWIWGAHAVEQALKNPKRRMVQLLVYPDLMQTAENWAVEHPNPPVIHACAKAQLQGLLPPEAVHQGYALQCHPLENWDLERFLDQQNKGCAQADQSAIILALDQVTDPHNVGAIWRSAAAFGAAGLLQTWRNAPLETGVLVKTACGGFDVTPQLRVVNLSGGLERLKDAGYKVLGFAGDAELSLEQILGANFAREHDLGQKLVIVLGAEGQGMRQKTRQNCDLLLKLPTRPPIVDLNVSNAAAMALYQLRVYLDRNAS